MTDYRRFALGQEWSNGRVSSEWLKSREDCGLLARVEELRLHPNTKLPRFKRGSASNLFPLTAHLVEKVLALNPSYTPGGGFDLVPILYADERLRPHFVLTVLDRNYRGRYWWDRLGRLRFPYIPGPIGMWREIYEMALGVRFRNGEKLEALTTEWNRRSDELWFPEGAGARLFLTRFALAFCCSEAANATLSGVREALQKLLRWHGKNGRLTKIIPSTAKRKHR